MHLSTSIREFPGLFKESGTCSPLIVEACSFRRSSEVGSICASTGSKGCLPASIKGGQPIKGHRNCLNHKYSVLCCITSQEVRTLPNQWRIKRLTHQQVYAGVIFVWLIKIKKRLCLEFKRYDKQQREDTWRKCLKWNLYGAKSRDWEISESSGLNSENISDLGDQNLFTQVLGADKFYGKSMVVIGFSNETWEAGWTLSKGAV